MHTHGTARLVCRHGSELDACPICLSALPLSARLDDLLEAARPRLLRLARLNRIATDELEDVLQETYVEAWRGLANLREPERFSSWLDGICRNVCKRHIRALVSDHGSQIWSDNERDNDAARWDIPDPLAIDPDEELERHDMQVLLDRALGYLSQSSRELIKLCYLAELPQREVAQRLDMSLSALEVKLHRARRQLRQVLNSDLRADAAEFGLLANEDEAMGWRETRQWCWMCGKRRLCGTFERRPSGVVSLRLRCPDCSTHPEVDISATNDWACLGDVRSFRPAIKRMFHACTDFYGTALGQKRCTLCQSPVQLQLIDRSNTQASDITCYLLPSMMYIRMDCPRCGSFLSILISALLNHPAISDFFVNRPRILCLPDVWTTYAGQEAIRSRLNDLSSGEQLTIMIHPETFQVMATLLE